MLALFRGEEGSKCASRVVGLLASGGLRPEGAEYDGPGRCPGEVGRNERRSPEGAKSASPWLLCRLFRACHFVLNTSPGRCPGLSYLAPLGLKEAARRLISRRLVDMLPVSGVIIEWAMARGEGINGRENAAALRVVV